MTKQERLERGEAVAAAPAASSPAMSGVHVASPLERATTKGIWYDELLRDLRVLATRDDGWLRLIPDVDRQRVWLKWKFTAGQHERKYIMVSCEDMRVHHGLQILVRKLYDVDMGILKPTLDRLYGQEEA